MATPARHSHSTIDNTTGENHRGLFLVPKGGTDMSRGEASESSFALSLDTLEQARRIVAQVELEMEQKTARERDRRMHPAPVAKARMGFWARAVRAIGI